MREKDAKKREATYQQLQREHQKMSPFIIMFQETEVVAHHKGVDGLHHRPELREQPVPRDQEVADARRSLSGDRRAGRDASAGSEGDLAPGARPLAGGAAPGTVALTFLGLLLVTFLIGRVVPIDPVLAAVGDRAPAEVYERVKHELGLHLPLWQQFWLYLEKVLTGDFGRSVLTSNPVLTDIRRVFPATIELATVATLIGVALGIPMGVVAAVARGPAGGPGRSGW